MKPTISAFVILRLENRNHLETLPDKLFLGNNQAEVPAGRYSFTYLNTQYTASGANKIRPYFYTEPGKFFDGWKWSFFSAPSKLGTDFDIRLFYRIDRHFQSGSLKSLKPTSTTSILELTNWCAKLE